ncbi:MAG TPA: hypothetical protein VMT46_16865 [Anaerolineaceae bacterium]|nr:hypothetical protein [Anaerolineaceae bacterium]
MVITESELREMWRDGKNALPPFQPGTSFTPAAQDFLKAHHQEIRFERPEHMTRLDAGHFVPKTDPRIRLRGRLDALHALVMLVAAQARRGLPRLAALLDALADYCREIQSAEYHGRPVSPLELDGKSAEEIHEISHHPERTLGIAHIGPGPDDLPILHWLNYLRASARDGEIVALEAYPPPGREDLSTALNRLSSAVYYLELLYRAGMIRWDSE